MSDTPKDVLDKIRQVKDEGLKELDLSWVWDEETTQLTEIPVEVFELENLEVLRLRSHGFTSVPKSISQLKNLKILDLASNQLSTLPESLYQLEKLTELDLGSNKLTTVPTQISKMKQLTSLSLRYNGLTLLPEWISQLPNLTVLDLSSNPLLPVPDWMAQMQKLKDLDLTGLELTTVPGCLAELRGLTQLGLGYNKLTSLPDSISNLQQLTNLFLAQNQFIDVPVIIKELRQLTNLGLARNRLNALPEWISELQNLTHLNLFETSLTDLPGTFASLQKMQWLRISNNRLTAIPKSIFNLNSLEELDCSNLSHVEDKNQIVEIPSEILQLRNLKVLDTEGNPIEIPPPDIVAKGIDAIRNYFQQLEVEGKDYLYEAKMLILGEGGAGKTSLAKKIENPKYELREEDSTQGIEVARWTFKMENGQPFRVNIWDFGGQEIYHSTHQFFLTKRSLYVLVADTRKEDTDFYYWLNAVELLSDNSPILIVKNEKQDRHREISDRQLRGQFSNLKETLPTNLSTNRGLDKLVGEIKYQISHLPQIGAPLPKSWVKVREALERDSRNYISFERYLNICEQNGFSVLKDKLQLIGYLHDLGVCLHFQDDPLLKKTVILKPKWGTDAVYKVLDNKDVIGNLGKFSRDDLATIWHEPEYADMQDELLQLMINFKLCYRIPNSEFYIAPQLLTENQPNYEWNETNNLILRYTYDSFMPKGMLTQFIVAMNRSIAAQKLVWKSGVVLEKGQTKAEVVEYYGKREIKIRLAGKDRKELLTIVMYELDTIHESYKRLKYSKLIPCNCDLCKNSQDPHFYAFEVLKRFLGDRQESIMCEKSYQMINVRALIDDVGTMKQIVEEATKSSRDFIFQGTVENLVIQQTEGGANIVERKDTDPVKVKSAWANGSFYLFTFAVVIAGLGVLARTVPGYALAGILTAGVIFVPLIGALQLKQDDRLSEKSFMELMKMVIGQLPLMGKLFGAGKNKS